MRIVLSIVLLVFATAFCGQDVAWSNTFTLSETTGIIPVSKGKQVLSGIIISKNPLKPVVTISVDYLPPAAQVEITIYSINGKAIKTLTADSKKIATGIEWNTADVSSGIYYICLSSGNNAINRRIVIAE